MVASPVFAALLAGVIATAVTHDSARGADECLTEPKQETPAGGHWRYHIDHANQRKCWYLKDESGKASQAPLAAPATDEAIPQSAADAHAELPAATPPSPQPRWISPAGFVKPDMVAPAGAGSFARDTAVPTPARDLSAPIRLSENDAKPAGDGAAAAQLPAAPPPVLLERVVDRGAADKPPAHETAENPLLTLIGLYMIGLGCAIIAICLVFKFATGAQLFPHDVLSRR
jgi:hypothetical protein